MKLENAILVVLYAMYLFAGVLFGFLLGTVMISTARADVDPVLVQAVIDVESSGNPKARGPFGEIGLMQLSPKAFPQYKARILFDPAINVRLGTEHLNKMKALCEDKLSMPGHPYTFVICYNQGPTRTPRHPELHPYYKKVMKAYQRRLAAQ